MKLQWVNEGKIDADKVSTAVSDCCHVLTIVRGDVTMYYECSKCGKPCNVYMATDKTLKENL